MNEWTGRYNENEGQATHEIRSLEIFKFRKEEAPCLVKKICIQL